MNASDVLDLAMPLMIAVFATALVWGQEWVFRRQRRREHEASQRGQMDHR